MRAGALLQTGAAEVVAGATGFDRAAFPIQRERGLILTVSLPILHLTINRRAIQTEIVNPRQLHLLDNRQQPMRLLFADVAVAQLLQIQRLRGQRSVVEQVAGDVINHGSLE